MTIASVDQLLAAAKVPLPFVQASIAGQAAGTLVSLWRAAGFPAAGAIPGAAAVPTGADTGFRFTNPSAPAATHLSRVAASGTIVGMLSIFDRLSHMGGLSGTVTTAQAVNTAAINRGDTTGQGVEAFLEWYTTTGATTATATVSWTDQGGTAGRSSAVSLAASRPAGFLAPIPLVAGTTGFRSVQTVTLSASTGTAGNFGVTLARRIADIPLTATNVPVLIDALTLGLPILPNDACLWTTYLTNGTSTGVISGSMQLAQG